MRPRLFALGGLAVGAVLALVAGSRAWWRAAGTGVSVTFSGTESSGGLAQALALVVLAGALLGLVLRSRGRRVLGILLVLTGSGVVVLGLMRSRPASGTVRTRVLEVSLADQFALTGTPWPYVYAVAGLLVVAAAAVMALTAPRWPSRAGRFERPVAVEPGQPLAATTGPNLPGDEDPAALWRLLDAGVDPTAAAEEPIDGPGTSGRPVVSEQPSGVTMKPRVASRTDEPT
ncbi:MAG TPA: Trp biosynthesis-associated membrane protein [Friedmanniella sp.]